MILYAVWAIGVVLFALLSLVWDVPRAYADWQAGILSGGQALLFLALLALICVLWWAVLAGVLLYLGYGRLRGDL